MTGMPCRGKWCVRCTRIRGTGRRDAHQDLARQVVEKASAGLFRPRLPKSHETLGLAFAALAKSSAHIHGLGNMISPGHAWPSTNRRVARVLQQPVDCPHEATVTVLRSSGNTEVAAMTARHRSTTASSSCARGTHALACCALCVHAPSLDQGRPCGTASPGYAYGSSATRALGGMQLRVRAHFQDSWRAAQVTIHGAGQPFRVQRCCMTAPAWFCREAQCTHSSPLTGGMA
jgi:hypothetical protein